MENLTLDYNIIYLYIDIFNFKFFSKILFCNEKKIFPIMLIIFEKQVFIFKTDTPIPCIVRLNCSNLFTLQKFSFSIECTFSYNRKRLFTSVRLRIRYYLRSGIPDNNLVTSTILWSSSQIRGRIVRNGSCSSPRS